MFVLGFLFGLGTFSEAFWGLCFWLKVKLIHLGNCEETQSKHDAALSSLREANMQLQAIWRFSML